MIAAKRDRCLNWEAEEKRLLKDILKTYINIIENKDLNTNTNKTKLNAWTEIAEKFNTANVRCRDKKQLMNQWKTIKLMCKKEMSHYRREVTMTGGGPKPPSPSPENIEITEMIPMEFVVDSNVFDSDGAKDTSTTFETVQIQLDDDVTPNPIYSIENTTNEKSAAVQNPDIIEMKAEDTELKTTPRKSDKKKKKQIAREFNFTEASYNDMHQYRETENKRMEEEHSMRMKIMAEQHEQIMKILKLNEEILKQKLSNS